MINDSCIDFINNLGSKSPTPGGGGASAYIGALGMALGAMVGNLTIGKNKYKCFEDENKILLKESYVIMDEFQQLITRDAECFLPLSKAYSLPAKTEDEKIAKENVLQNALVDATLVPLEIARLSLRAIKIHERFLETGTKMAISDVGVGALFCKSAFLGAKLNVLINIKLMKNSDLKTMVEHELMSLEKNIIPKADKIYNAVELELKK